MKNVILIIITVSLLIACNKEKEGEIKDITGEWIFISREEVATNHIDIYPDSLDSKLELEFIEDTIKFFGCNRYLGNGTYTLDNNDNFSVNSFHYIEVCGSFGWTGKVAIGIIYSHSIDLVEDTLLIYYTNYEQRDFILRFLGKETLEY